MGRKTETFSANGYPRNAIVTLTVSLETLATVTFQGNGISRATFGSRCQDGQVGNMKFSIIIWLQCICIAKRLNCYQTNQNQNQNQEKSES